MNFTREPIIETIMTPKEGYRLIVRSSKRVSQEEYSVDALEIVSFGSAIFYRSSERPKPFLVPVADFEVVEVKETRVVLKNVNLERSIKIGGGKEPPKESSRESTKESREPAVVALSKGEDSSKEGAAIESNTDKKRDRRHRRRRRGERLPVKDEITTEGESKTPQDEEEGGVTVDETKVSSPSFSSLFPPPTTLISQTIARYKDQALAEGNFSAKSLKSPSLVEAEKENKELPLVNVTSQKEEVIYPTKQDNIEQNLSFAVEEETLQKKKEELPRGEIIELQEAYPSPSEEKEKPPHDEEDPF